MHNNQRSNLSHEQAESLTRRLQENNGEYVLPDKTTVVHEGDAYPNVQPMRNNIPHTPETVVEASVEASIEPPVPQESPEITTNQSDVILAPPEHTFNNPGNVDNTDEIKKKIAEYEQALGEVESFAAEDVATFRDSSGNETFYVKNITGRHVVISDIDGMKKIKAGTSTDLLKEASIEDLKKSRDLRVLVYNTGSDKSLKRLTEREYLEEKRKEYENKQKVDAIRRQERIRTNNPNMQQQEPLPHERVIGEFATASNVRPVIEAKLGKLELKNDPNPENSRLAMTPIEFIQWVQAEPLSHSEIDFILGNPVVARDHTIRVALLEKKKSTPSN